MRLYRRLMLLAAFLVWASALQATHLRTADVTVERVCGSPLTFKIRITAYLSTSSNTRFGGSRNLSAIIPGQDSTVLGDGYIGFGDGQIMLIPLVDEVERPDLGPNISVAVFEVTHTYASPGIYRINYYERDRSSGILNITGADEVPYNSFATINATNQFGCNHYPELTIPPVDKACKGSLFTHTPGAVDEDGDSLSFELTTPAGWNRSAIPTYVSPDNAKFYLNPAAGNEAGTGPPVFSINPETGLITWDAPGMVGEYNIAFRIIEWKKDPSTGQPVMMSATIRDMQIVVQDCPNQRPQLADFPADICVVAGTSIHQVVKGTDPEHRNVKIEVVSEVIGLPADKKPATYSPFPSVFVPSIPPAEVTFDWNTDCIHVRQQPYQVIFKITDDPPGGTPLVTFKTWLIRVIAPAPQWQNQSTDLVNRNVTLRWDRYSCSNYSGMEVWRKVGANPFTQPACQVGLNRNTGYELIAVVDPSKTSFVDDNNGNKLATAAQYCYRLVAKFDTPASTRSRVSVEACIDPILTDAPVITHVSVVKTSDQGDIRVSWRSPLKINAVQFPKPYKYEIYRANDFYESSAPEKVDLVESDTSFLDQGINTRDSVFNYRIVIYSKPQNASAFVPIDTSATASSVRLSGIGGIKRIELAWQDSVPWSNVVIGSPHKIYRGLSENNLSFYANADVTTDGFKYVDENVSDTTLYYYKVVTVGTYGNPKIALQENESQIISVYPENTLLPCIPVASITITDCTAFREANTCGQNEFSNSISWTPVFETDCREDIVAYNVYAASAMDSEYELIAANVKETFLTESGLPSFARCYRVSAIDGKGQESEMSEPVCNENCPYFELPNVFTPNADGCNDFMSASDEDNAPCGFSGRIKCSRFVKEVKLHVYNRWGKEVYSFNSGDGKSVYINWDGRDNSGTMLQAAVYFYVADVTFNTADPAVRTSKVKGWVQLLY